MLTSVIGPNGKTRPARAGSSASSHEAITAGDTTASNFAGGVCTAIWVGTGGDVAAVVDGTAVTYKNVPSGYPLPVNATRVNSTNTTAADMVAMFG